MVYYQVDSQIVIKIKDRITVKVVIGIFYLKNNLISYAVRELFQGVTWWMMKNITAMVLKKKKKKKLSNK